MNTKKVEDKAALKELVDSVSILADKKDVHNQVQLFSENAISETYTGGKAILKLKGRKEMEEAFGGFLKDFETVYHFNGQHIVSVNGDNAIGTCYCLITLIGKENGTMIKLPSALFTTTIMCGRITAG
jgi:ketosteroid isomerase-like protein